MAVYAPLYEIKFVRRRAGGAILKNYVDRNHITNFVAEEFELDEVDQQILEILRHDSRTSNIQVAKKVGLTEGTVRNRIRRLIETGIIKRFTVETQAAQAEAIVLIQTHTRGSREVLRRIRKLVDRLFETAGEFDVAAYLTADSIAAINALVDKLRRVEGVTSTVTLLKIADDKLQ
jgi:Lrp/AsnC family transcriptional regulator of lysine biosynthesis